MTGQPPSRQTERESRVLLRQGSSVESETDMSDYEGALNNCICHTFRTGVQRSWCGQITRDEQPPHGRTEPHEAKLTPFCPFCGQQRCSECREAIRRYLP